MTSSIDFDRLHAAWQVLDRKVERLDAESLQQARVNSATAIRRRLRPLAWGQVSQMLLGIALIVMAVPVWRSYSGLPHVFVSGLILHGYGVASILLGGVTLGLLSRLDYGAPVVVLQTRLLRVQKAYVMGSTTLGLAWWLLWIPFMSVLCAWMGVDFVAHVSPAMPWLVAGGVAGLVATGAFHRWARKRPALHAWLQKSMTGRSLTAANSDLQALHELGAESDGR